MLLTHVQSSGGEGTSQTGAPAPGARGCGAGEKRHRVIQISVAALVAVAFIAAGVLAASAGDDSGG